MVMREDEYKLIQAVRETALSALSYEIDTFLKRRSVKEILCIDFP